MNKLKDFMSNRLYRAILYVVLCVIIAMTATITQAIKDRAKYTEMMEQQREQIVAEYEQTIIEMNTAHEREIAALEYRYEYGGPEDALTKEAEYIAKVLYGTARNHNSIDQRTVVWCILNRVDHSNYPDNVQGVCQQASQWIGYSDDNPILDDLYELALGELKIWHNGRRPVGEDYIYMSWSSKEISLRNTYEKKDNTRYWRAN